MNLFEQFAEFLNSKTFCNNAEMQIEEHEDKEAAFARELAELLEKYGLELQDEEDDAYDDEVDEDFENESDEERAKKDVAKGFKEKEKAKTEKERADADEKIEKAELRENKDEKKEYNNSANDFDFFQQRYNKTVKAAPSVTFNSIEEQRKLGKEIF